MGADPRSLAATVAETWKPGHQKHGLPSNHALAKIVVWGQKVLKDLAASSAQVPVVISLGVTR